MERGSLAWIWAREMYFEKTYLKGQMGPLMKDFTSMVKSMGKGSMFGMTVVILKETGSKTEFLDSYKINFTTKGYL